jgi:CTP synthase (UTP-ammonia lyase)
VRTARERGIPFLGTCGGFQHALLEFARHVCGIATARHTENQPGDPGGGDVLIAPLACSLVGHEGRLRTVPGSLAERLLGSRDSVERFHCAYGPVAALLPRLEAAGMRFTAHDLDGEPRGGGRGRPPPRGDDDRHRRRHGRAGRSRLGRDRARTRLPDADRPRQ